MELGVVRCRELCTIVLSAAVHWIKCVNVCFRAGKGAVERCMTRCVAKVLCFCLKNVLFEPLHETQLRIIFSPALQLKLYDVRFNATYLDSIKQHFLKFFPFSVSTWAAHVRCNRAHARCITFSAARWHLEVDYANIAFDNSSCKPSFFASNIEQRDGISPPLYASYAALGVQYFLQQITSKLSVRFCCPSLHVSSQLQAGRMGLLCRASRVTLRFPARSENVCLNCVYVLGLRLALFEAGRKAKRVLARLTVNSCGNAALKLDQEAPLSFRVVVPRLQLVLADVLIPALTRSSSQCKRWAFPLQPGVSRSSQNTDPSLSDTASTVSASLGYKRQDLDLPASSWVDLGDVLRTFSLCDQDALVFDEEKQKESVYHSAASSGSSRHGGLHFSFNSAPPKVQKHEGFDAEDILTVAERRVVDELVLHVRFTDGAIILCSDTAAPKCRRLRKCPACCVAFNLLELTMTKTSIFALTCAVHDTLAIHAVDVVWPAGVAENPGPWVCWIESPEAAAAEEESTSCVNQKHPSIVVTADSSYCSVGLGSICFLVSDDTLKPLAAAAVFGMSCLDIAVLFNPVSKKSMRVGCSVKRFAVAAAESAGSAIWCSCCGTDINAEIKLLSASRISMRLSAHYALRFGCHSQSKMILVSSFRSPGLPSESAPWEVLVVRRQRLTDDSNETTFFPGSFFLSIQFPILHIVYSAELYAWLVSFSMTLRRWILLTLPTAGSESVFMACFARDQLIVEAFTAEWFLETDAFTLPLVIQMTKVETKSILRFPRVPSALALWSCRTWLGCKSMHIALPDTAMSTSHVFTVQQLPTRLVDAALAVFMRTRKRKIERLSVALGSLVIDVRGKVLRRILKAVRELIWYQRALGSQSGSQTTTTTPTLLDSSSFVSSVSFSCLDARVIWVLRRQSPVASIHITHLNWTKLHDPGFVLRCKRLQLGLADQPPRSCAIDLFAVSQLVVEQAVGKRSASAEGLTGMISVVTLDVLEEASLVLRRAECFGNHSTCGTQLPTAQKLSYTLNINALSISLSPLCWAQTSSHCPGRPLPCTTELCATGVTAQIHRAVPRALDLPTLTANSVALVTPDTSGALHFRVLDQRLDAQRSTVCVGTLSCAIQSCCIRDLARASKFPNFLSSSSSQAASMHIREMLLFPSVPSLALRPVTSSAAAGTVSLKPDSSFCAADAWTWLVGREDCCYPGLGPFLSSPLIGTPVETPQSDAMCFAIDVSIEIQPLRITADQRFLNSLETLQRRFSVWARHPSKPKRRKVARCGHNKQLWGPTVRYLAMSSITLIIDFRPAPVSATSQRRHKTWLHKRTVNRVLAPIGGIQQLSIVLPQQTLRDCALYTSTGQQFCVMCAIHGCVFCAEQELFLFGAFLSPTLRTAHLFQLASLPFWSKVLERLVRGGWAPALDASRLARAVVLHATTVQPLKRLGTAATMLILDAAYLRKSNNCKFRSRHPRSFQTLFRQCALEAIGASAKLAGAATQALRQSEWCNAQQTLTQRVEKSQQHRVPRATATHESRFPAQNGDVSSWSFVEYETAQFNVDESENVVPRHTTRTLMSIRGTERGRTVSKTLAQALRTLPFLLARPITGIFSVIISTLQLTSSPQTSPSRNVRRERRCPRSVRLSTIQDSISEEHLSVS